MVMGNVSHFHGSQTAPADASCMLQLEQVVRGTQKVLLLDCSAVMKLTLLQMTSVRSVDAVLQLNVVITPATFN